MWLKKSLLTVMGNTFAKAQSVDSDLHTRIRKLEQAADLNGDGVVTRAELEEYAARELKLRESEILSLRAELVELRQQKRVAEEKAERETEKYNTLYKRHEAYLEMISKEKEEQGSSAPPAISNKAIERFVDELLADPNINIYMLPDSIERPLYRNTLKILLSTLQKVFNNANIDLIGHEFKVHMQPTLETRLQDGVGSATPHNP